LCDYKTISDDNTFRRAITESWWASRLKGRSHPHNDSELADLHLSIYVLSALPMLFSTIKWCSETT